MSTPSVFESWEQGNLTDREALYPLLNYLGEVEDTAKSLSREKEAVRDQIGRIVARAGDDKIEIVGLATVRLTSPSAGVKFDTKQVNELIIQLVTEGNPHMAQRLIECRRDTFTAGSLRVEFARKR